MYAPKLLRIVSICNRNLVVASRQLLSSQQYLKSQNFIVNCERYKSHVKSKSLTSILISSNSSPEDSKNVSKEKVVKKRRRIISSDSSSGDDSPAKSKPTESEK